MLIQDFILEGGSLVLVNALKEVTPLHLRLLMLCTAPYLIFMIFARLSYPMSACKAIDLLIY